MVSVEAGTVEQPGGGDSGEEEPVAFPESLDVVSYSTGSEVLLTTLIPLAVEVGYTQELIPERFGIKSIS